MGVPSIVVSLARVSAAAAARDGKMAATATALVPGAGWQPHADALAAASTASDLLRALRALHGGLSTGACFPREGDVQAACAARYAAVGPEWTREVAQWYLRVMNLYAAPVVPATAYEGQFMPPAYLFTPAPSALIPVVQIPPPVMPVVDAVVVPAHNDGAFFVSTDKSLVVPATAIASPLSGGGGNAGPVVQATAIATPTAVATTVVDAPTAGESKTQPSSPPQSAARAAAAAASEGDAIFVNFDKVPTNPGAITPAPFVYAAPTAADAADDGSAVYLPSGKNGPAIPAAEVQQAIVVAVPQVKPKPEVTLDMYKDGDETSTDVWCEEEEYFNTTHLNLWNNDISTIAGLKKFPNLLRLTVRSNELKNLQGINESSTLRWLDASNNDVNSLKGLEHMPSLEWLDLHDNEFKNLDGMGALPQLTFLNMRHSDLTRLDGIERMIPRVRYLDLSSNDLQSVSGLEKCVYLTEVNLNYNDLKDFGEVLPLFRLPYLARLDLSNNHFSDAAVRNLKKAAAKRNPKLRLIFDSAEAGASSNGQRSSGSSGGGSGGGGGGGNGCCSVQ